MSRKRRIAVFVLALLLQPLPGVSRVAAQTVADSAWHEGDHARAEQLYRARLTENPKDDVALQRLGLLLAWRGDYAGGLQYLDSLLTLYPQHWDGRLSRARVLAWSGNVRAAVAAVDSVISAEPQNLEALRARAQFLSWAGEYDASLRAYNELGAQAPGENVLVDRLRVLRWSHRYGAAITAARQLLARDPNNAELQLVIADAFTAAGDLDSARAVYSALLSRNPRQLEAMQGIARAETWSGHLVDGERRWRAALDVASSDVTTLVGLAQALRWQGRSAAAWELLEQARHLKPTDADVREQMRYARLPLAPRAAASFVREHDSDDNTMTTLSALAAWRPALRTQLRAEGHLRDTRDPVGTRSSYGVALSLTQQLEPGWNLGVGAGASGTTDGDVTSEPTWHASLSSPGRNAVGFTASVERALYDVTAALIRNDVHTTDASLELSLRRAGWTMSALGSAARFASDVSGSNNDRWLVDARAARRMTPPLTLGLRARGYGFERDANDGYFDPRLFAVAELTARCMLESRHWVLDVEGAPGLQRVDVYGRAASNSASYRASGRAAFVLAPGRELGLTFAASNSGAQRVSEQAGDHYRYYSIGIAGSWIF